MPLVMSDVVNALAPSKIDATGLVLYHRELVAAVDCASVPLTYIVSVFLYSTTAMCTHTPTLMDADADVTRANSPLASTALTDTVLLLLSIVLSSTFPEVSNTPNTADDAAMLFAYTQHSIVQSAWRSVDGSPVSCTLVLTPLNVTLRR
jgi:hypothetical protein